MNKFENLLKKEIVEELLVSYGKYLFDSGAVLSIAECMDRMNGLFTELTNDGYIMISTLDSVREKLKNLKLIQSGASARSTVVTRNNKALVTNSTESLIGINPAIIDSGNSGLDDATIEIVKTYTDAIATLKAIKPKLELRFKALSDEVLKDLLDIYKSNFESGFIDLYIY